jgi:DNA-directed RNA polymerase III subunit RPC6
MGGRPKYRAIKPDLETEHTQLLYRAGTHSYPTADDIHKFLTTSSAIKPTKAASLTVAEIQGCIDVLMWDDKLEKIRRHDGAGWGYRTVRGVTFKAPGSVFEEYEEAVGTGLTQAPCGHCPVFDICHDDGPINAAECVYFEQWLKV